MSSIRSSEVHARDSHSSRGRGLRATNWPLRDAPGSCLASLLVCVGVVVACGAASGNWLMGIVSGLAMATTCWKLWVPITTEFEPRGVVLAALGQRRRISWREIDHFELRERGVFLCTLPGPVHENPLRCLFLPWVEDRQGISEFCDEYRPMDRLG